MCQDILVELKSFCLVCSGSSADTLVVELVPVACHQAKLAIQLKRVTVRGHGASCLMTHPCACKVTQITSPLPEVLTVIPPVAGPSQTIARPLFEESAV